ncbi:hypothetical protein ACFL59_16440 [Planctomycetota bacterium]
MPADVRALRGPWYSVASQVTDLTPEYEREFRFGKRVCRTDKGFLVGGSLKGGSSSIWSPAGTEIYEAYLAWRALEGIEPDEDQSGFMRLLDFLRAHGVSLRGGFADRLPVVPAPFDARYALVYPLLDAILRELPSAHVSRSQLTAVQIGGWGSDGAKASSFDRGIVHLYDFAIKGARRTLAGLFLHELGHAQEDAFTEEELARLERAHHTIVAERGLYGMEFLLSRDARIAYQTMSLNEFLAETYLAYTACGAKLRSFINRQTLCARDAWFSVYTTFRKAFSGIEYA